MAVLLFVLVLAFLVLIHELGHFIAALWTHVHVQEFGIGLPPRARTLFSWRGVPFTLNWLAIGGFVRMEGEDGDQDEEIARPVGTYPFYQRPLIEKIAVVFAGPLVNILFAVSVFSLLFSIYGVPERVGDHPIISGVAQDSPARAAGFVSGDMILSLAQIDVTTNEELIAAIGQLKGKQVTLTLKRSGQTQDVSIYIRRDDQIPTGQGALGIELAGEFAMHQYPLWQRPLRGMKAGVMQSMDLSRMILHSLGSIGTSLLAKKIPSDVSGPVGIAAAVTKEGIFSNGIASSLHFSALLSLNLAVMNLLPIPALDGGRIVLLLLEKVVAKKRFSAIVSVLNTGGFVLLLVLMGLITIKDILALFSHS